MLAIFVRRAGSVAKRKELIRFDWFMKFMLRDEVGFEILAGFLSELLKEDVEVIALLESEGNQKSKDDKFNRVDVMVRTSKQELMIVEIQNEFEIDFLQRLLYGTSKATTEYIHKSDAYGKIERIISVSIVYFELGQGIDYVYVGQTNFVGLHQHDVLQLSERQKGEFLLERVAEIFPTYYLIRAEFFKGIITDGLDQWIYFFKNGEVQEGFDAKGLVKASEVLDYQKMPPEEKAKYDAYYRNLREENSWAWSRRVEMEEAVAQAKLEMEEAMKEVETKAREGMERAALALHEQGVAISVIALAMKMSEERIREVIDQRQDEGM
jgi:predicted transposase/invertase (TIGR01784 family)